VMRKNVGGTNYDYSAYPVLSDLSFTK